MHSFFQDLQYSGRQFLKHPGFTLTAVLSLTLGIGATTAVFSVIYGGLLNPYPFREANRILRLSAATKSGSVETIGLNIPQIQQLRQLDIIKSVLAMDYHAMTTNSQGLPENVNVIGLISNGFQDLGVPPLQGRGLLPSDAVDGQEPQPVAVVSYKFWQERLGGDPGAVGKQLQLDRSTYTIVGVAAPRFKWYMADVYLPLKMTPDANRFCIVNFRLKQGVSLAAANTALQALLDQFAKEIPQHFPEDFKMQVEGLNAGVDRYIGGTLYLLFGAVALLLTIGCANVSILLLAQGTARQQEFAVRAALGAHSPRLVRQLLTESALLSTLGVFFGVLASYGMLTGIKTLLPRYAFAPEVEIGISLPVLFFSVVVALATVLLFGLWPALQVSRAPMIPNTRRIAGSVRGRRTHNTLVAIQIGLTLVLLSGAGTAMKGFLRLLHAPLGYDPHHVMSVGIPLHENSYTTWAVRAAYFGQLRSKVAQTPGVTMAAISSNATPPRNGSNDRFEILGKPSADEQTASVNLISPEYFPTLRIPLREGRLWNESENQNAAHVAVINRTLAQRYFANTAAVGQSVKLPAFEERPPAAVSAANIANSWLQIIGIVEDARNDGLSKPIRPAIYVPFTFNMRMGTQVLVRSEVPPLTLLHSVRLQLTAVNPDQQSYNTSGDLEAWNAEEPDRSQEQLAAWIFGVFSALALTLAAVGLYSVVSYTVAQRTNEIGIRLALGAPQSHILRTVIQSILSSVGTGILSGIVASLALSRMLMQWAQESSRDPLILLAGAFVLSLVAGISCAIPAWKASRLDPMLALRSE